MAEKPSFGALDKLRSVEELRNHQASLKNELDDLNTEYDGLPFPDDVAGVFAAKTEEHTEVGRRIAELEGRKALLERMAGNGKNEERTWEVPHVQQINRKSEADIYSFESRAGTLEQRNQEYRDDAMRAVEIATFPNPHTDVQATRDKIARMLDYDDTADKQLARRIKATGSPLYRRAFEKIIKGRGTISLTPEELRGTALAVGVDGTGGFTVPFAFDPTVIAIGVHTGAINFYRRVCRTVSIVGTDTWNALTATAVTATRTTEAAPAIEQGPTFAQPQYIVHRVQAQITASMEMFQDRTDLSSEMATLIQEAKDNEEEASFAIGVGSTVTCIGVCPVYGTSGAYTQLDTAGSTVLAAADADLVEAALPVRHRFNAVWAMNRTTLRKFQSLETTGGKLFGGSQYPAVGNPVTQSDGNTGLRLLGYPVNEAPSIATAATSHITIAVLFNPQSYVIVDRVGMNINFIPFIFGASQGNLVTGQQAIYAMWRNHAAPLNVDAGRILDYKT